jgi:zinc transporter 1/2/3
MIIFLMDFGAEQYVDRKYGLAHGPNVENLITDKPGVTEGGDPLAQHQHENHKPRSRSLTHQQLHSGDQDQVMHDSIAFTRDSNLPSNKDLSNPTNGQDHDSEKGRTPSAYEIEEMSFRQQIAAFLILEFGVIFHSVIIGLNLGSTGSEFATLYPVLVFHQSFEGLGIGARMSAIPFPKRYHWLPWFLCASYGLTTPISIAIGLGLRTTYDSGSFTANVVSGVLDAISAGILIYTGLVELLARDFLFNPDLTRDRNRLIFMMVCVFLGAALMALLGKWA